MKKFPEPFTLLSGVNDMSPLTFIVNVPTFGITYIPPVSGLTVVVIPFTVKLRTEIGSPSISESFPRTFPVDVRIVPALSFASKENISFVAFGLSLTAATFINNSAVSEPPFPSLTV